MNQTLLIAIIVMVCTGAFLTLAQMWFTLLSWDVFVKLIITLGILTVLAAFVMVIKSDLGSHKKMKDENYLD